MIIPTFPAFNFIIILYIYKKGKKRKENVFEKLPNGKAEFCRLQYIILSHARFHIDILCSFVYSYIYIYIYIFPPPMLIAMLHRQLRCLSGRFTSFSLFDPIGCPFFYIYIHK